jgi:hypothetical protein
MTIRNKLVPGRPLQAILMFGWKVGAYSIEAHFRYSHIALSTNIRLGWKGLPGTNTLAFHEHSQITDVKVFVTLGRVRVGVH